MSSKFHEDQAEQLRKQIEGIDSVQEASVNGNENGVETEIDVLSLPSRKEKFNKKKKSTEQNNIQQEGEIEATTNKSPQDEVREARKARRRKMKFPLIRVLLVLFFLLVTLLLTYPIWIERLNG